MKSTYVRIGLNALVAIFIALAFSMGSCSGHRDSNDWTRAGLKGKVESVRETRFVGIDRLGDIEKGEQWETSYRLFSANGEAFEEIKVEEDSIQSDGELSMKLTTEHDDKGNTIEECYYHADGTLNFKFTYTYSNKSTLTEVRMYCAGDVLNFVTTYKYNYKGDWIEKNDYDANEKLISTETNTYEYDKKDNWIKRIEFYDGILKYITEREIQYY